MPDVGLSQTPLQPECLLAREGRTKARALLVELLTQEGYAGLKAKDGEHFLSGLIGALLSPQKMGAPALAILDTKALSQVRRTIWSAILLLIGDPLDLELTGEPKPPGTIERLNLPPLREELQARPEQTNLAHLEESQSKQLTPGG